MGRRLFLFVDNDDSTNTKLQMSESCPDEATTSILIADDAANASHSTAPMNQAEKLFEYEWFVSNSYCECDTNIM
jgi:hypothetical protein